MTSHQEKPWTREEDRIAWGLCNWPGPVDWDIASGILPGRSEQAIASRFADYLQPLRRSFKPTAGRSFAKWSKEEDVIIMMTCEGTDTDTEPNWDVVSRGLLGRTSDDVKFRYLNYLRPWTQEEKAILALHVKQGSTIKIMVNLLPRHAHAAVSAARKRQLEHIRMER